MSLYTATHASCSLQLFIPQAPQSSLTPPHLQILQLGFQYSFSHLCIVTSPALYQFHFLQVPVKTILFLPLSLLSSIITVFCKRKSSPGMCLSYGHTHIRFAIAQNKGKVGGHDTYSWSHTIHHWRPGHDYNQVLPCE